MRPAPPALARARVPARRVTQCSPTLLPRPPREADPDVSVRKTAPPAKPITGGRSRGAGAGWRAPDRGVPRPGEPRLVVHALRGRPPVRLGEQDRAGGDG